MNLTVGSGDIGSIMAGIHTKTYKDFIRKFLAEEKPYYNALASPINALRTGAILESNYLRFLPDNYYSQYKVTSKEMDCFTSSIDFAKLENGKIVDFDELKTMFFVDYIDLIEPLKGEQAEVYLPVIKKKFKKYYQQVQTQLYCSGLQSCNLVFLVVNSYDDDENTSRVITSNDIAVFRINRDEKVIESIKSRGVFFQGIKDHFKQ